MNMKSELHIYPLGEPNEENHEPDARPFADRRRHRRVRAGQARRWQEGIEEEGREEEEGHDDRYHAQEGLVFSRPFHTKSRATVAGPARLGFSEQGCGPGCRKRLRTTPIAL